MRKGPAPVPIDLLSRKFAAVSREKALYWREFKRRYGPAAGVRVGDDLRRRAFALRSEWPSDAERQRDHNWHLRMIDALARADRGRR